MSYKMCLLYIFIVAVAVKCSCRNVPLHVFDCCRLGGRKKLQHPLSTSSDAPQFQPIIAHRPMCRFVGSSWDVVLGFLRARGGIVQLSMLSLRAYMQLSSSVECHQRIELRDVSGRPGHQEPGYPRRQAGRYPRRCAFAKRLLHDPGRNSVQHHAWRY